MFLELCTIGSIAFGQTQVFSLDQHEIMIELGDIVDSSGEVNINFVRGGSGAVRIQPKTEEPSTEIVTAIVSLPSLFFPVFT
jgi:hypothetical protein